MALSATAYATLRHGQFNHGHEDGPTKSHNQRIEDTTVSLSSLFLQPHLRILWRKIKRKTPRGRLLEAILVNARDETKYDCLGWES